MTWRETAAPIIAKVIRDVGRDDMRVLSKALREAYPFGSRGMHPYKIWLSEIKNQLGRPLNTPRTNPNDTQKELF